jgi:hypothetical protein
VRWLGLGAVVVGGLGLGRMAHAASPEGAGEGRPYYCERVASSPDDWAVYPECAARETSPSKAEKTRPLVCMGLEATRDVWLAYPECRGVVKAPEPVAEKKAPAPAYCRGLTSSGDLVAYPECASAASFETSSGAPRRGAPSFCDGVAPGPENDLAYPECVR